MKTLRRIATVSLVAMLAIATIEMAMRTSHPRDRWMDILRTAAPEIFDTMQAIRWNDDGPADIASASLNVRNGERVTTGQPQDAINDIYIFGSSTTFGVFNDDAGTLPSQLQALMPTYRVHNRGAAGDSTPILLAKMKQTALKPGDVVIFYDGVTELRHIGDDLDKRDINLCHYLLENANDVLIFHALCDGRAAAYPDASVIQNAVNQFRRNVATAERYAKSRGAAFYNILEPTKFSVPESARQMEIDSYEPVVETMRVAYPLFYAQVPGVNLGNMTGLDYVDNYHVTDASNAAVARAIVAALRQTF